MYNSFISIVSVIDSETGNLKEYIQNIHSVLVKNFTDFEIILVNNGAINNVSLIFNDLDQDIRRSVIVLNLSKKIDPHNAVIAGLDRANGDYTLLFNITFFKKETLILDLYKRTQENYDIVYIKYKKRRLSLLRTVLFKVFYLIMKRFAVIEVDMNMHESRIISRRALNAILQVRDQLKYTKILFSSIGYKTDFIEVDLPDLKTREEKLSMQIKQALSLIFSYTNLISRLLLWIFVSTVLLNLGFAVNALMVKFSGINVFGKPQVHVPGWTFLVLLIILMFSILFLILYLFSIYLENITKEVKRQPLYFIESIQRF